jgi:hypothetical protein
VGALVFVSVSSSSTTVSTATTAVATTAISAAGVEGRTCSCIADFLGKSSPFGLFFESSHDFLSCGSRDLSFEDLDGHFISVCQGGEDMIFHCFFRYLFSGANQFLPKGNQSIEVLGYLFVE